MMNIKIPDTISGGDIPSGSYAKKIIKNHFSVQSKRVHLGCVLDRIPTKEVKTVFETFGGCGVSQSVVRDRFPEAQSIAVDCDPLCVQIYEYNFGPGHIILANSYKITDYPHRDLYLMDYNRFTLKNIERGGERYRLFRRVLVEVCPKYICFTDSAAKYFHINGWKSYRCSSIDEYAERVNGYAEGFGYNAVNWSGFSEATYFLWKRKERGNNE